MTGAYFGEFIAVLTTLSWTLCVFPFTEASRRLGPNETNHLRLVLAVLMLMIAGVLTSSLGFSDFFVLPHVGQWFWLGLSGLMGLALGDYLGFTMYSILGTRLGSVFTTLSPGAALLLGYLYLGETVNAIGIAGLIVTVLGVVWLSLNKKDDAPVHLAHGNRNKGILFGVLAALCQGIGLVMAKKGLMSSPDVKITAIHATWIRMFVAMVGIFAFTFTQKKAKVTYKAIKGNNQNAILYVLIGTVFGPVLGVSLSLYTISLIQVSVAQTIFSLVPVFVLPLSFIIYKEKITIKSALGVLIALSGVILLIWREAIQGWIAN